MFFHTRNKFDSIPKENNVIIKQINKEKEIVV